MPTADLGLSSETVLRVERSAGELSSAATRRMEAAHDWYRALSAEDRSWVGLVAQAGIAAFIAWLRDGGDQAPVTADVFGTAPRELTRSITLRHTLDLVRSVVDVGKAYGLVVTAEGIEDAATLQAVRDLGIDYAQGYYLSRPQPAPDLVDLLASTWRH